MSQFRKAPHISALYLISSASGVLPLLSSGLPSGPEAKLTEFQLAKQREDQFLDIVYGEVDRNLQEGKFILYEQDRETASESLNRDQQPFSGSSDTNRAQEQAKPKEKATSGTGQKQSQLLEYYTAKVQDVAYLNPWLESHSFQTQQRVDHGRITHGYKEIRVRDEAWVEVLLELLNGVNKRLAPKKSRVEYLCCGLYSDNSTSQAQADPCKNLRNMWKESPSAAKQGLGKLYGELQRLPGVRNWFEDRGYAEYSDDDALHELIREFIFFAVFLPLQSYIFDSRVLYDSSKLLRRRYDYFEGVAWKDSKYYEPQQILRDPVVQYLIGLTRALVLVNKLPTLKSAFFIPTQDDTFVNSKECFRSILLDWDDLKNYFHRDNCNTNEQYQSDPKTSSWATGWGGAKDVGDYYKSLQRNEVTYIFSDTYVFRAEREIFNQLGVAVAAWSDSSVENEVIMPIGTRLVKGERRRSFQQWCNSIIPVTVTVHERCQRSFGNEGEMMPMRQVECEP